MIQVYANFEIRESAELPTVGGGQLETLLLIVDKNHIIVKVVDVAICTVQAKSKTRVQAISKAGVGEEPLELPSSEK